MDKKTIVGKLRECAKVLYGAAIFKRFSKHRREPVAKSIEEQLEEDFPYDGGWNTEYLAGRCRANEEKCMNATDEELASIIQGDLERSPGRELEDVITDDGAMSETPHAWRTLCFRFGEELARRLVFEGPLSDSSDWVTGIPERRSCAIVGIHSGKVVCSEKGGVDPLAANRRICLGCWELFTFVKNDDGSFSIKSAANDKFVSANPNHGDQLIAEGARVDLWEKFDIKEVAGKPGVVTLWSHVTKKFVSVDETQGNVLVANREVASDWEEFRIFCR